MNNSNTRHPFALRAALLSVLITASMALLPALAGAGAKHGSRDLQAIQTAAVQSQRVGTAG